MHWEEAKKFLILVLIILNAGLLVLNIFQSNKYKIDKERENYLYQILDNNNISLECDIIRKYKPMRRLTIYPEFYSRDEIIRMFFKEADITITFEFDKTILKGKNKTVTISNNNEIVVDYINKSDIINNFNEETAKRQAESFIFSMNNKFVYQLNKSIKINDGYFFQYCQEYDSNVVFPISYNIYVNEYGILKVETIFYGIDGFTGEDKEICGIDEALFTFIKEKNEKRKFDEIIIEDIKLGYNFQSIENSPSENIRLVPCYNIYVKDENEPYIINAYTNEIIKNKAHV